MRVTRSDLIRLQENVFVNDTIIDFYLRWDFDLQPFTHWNGHDLDNLDPTFAVKGWHAKAVSYILSYRSHPANMCARTVWYGTLSEK